MNAKPEDLEIRTRRFAIEVMGQIKKIKLSIYNEHIIRQLLRSSSSIGANYSEAKETITKKDFVNKIVVCKKEAKETIYWLDLLGSEQNSATAFSLSRNEAHEFIMIFVAMIRN